MISNRNDGTRSAPFILETTHQMSCHESSLGHEVSFCKAEKGHWMYTRAMKWERLALIRKAKNMNQEDVAKYLGCSLKTYSRWERHEFEPSISDLCKLSKLYQCSIDFLIGNDEYQVFSPKEAAVILNAMQIIQSKINNVDQLGHQIGQLEVPDSDPKK